MDWYLIHHVIIHVHYVLPIIHQIVQAVIQRLLWISYKVELVWLNVQLENITIQKLVNVLTVPSPVLAVLEQQQIVQFVVCKTIYICSTILADKIAQVVMSKIQRITFALNVTVNVLLVSWQLQLALLA